jgi:hypothetical protein
LPPCLAHQLLVSEAGNCLSEPAEVVTSDPNAHRPGILGKAAANVLNARQAQLSRSRIEAGQHVIWYVTDQYVTHTQMISPDIALFEAISADATSAEGRGGNAPNARSTCRR